MGVGEEGAEAEEEEGEGGLIVCMCILLATMEVNLERAEVGEEEGAVGEEGEHVLLAGRRMEDLVLCLNLRQGLCKIV